MIDSLIPLITLIALELILGIDNVIFISILSDKLPLHQRKKLLYTGLGIAVVLRLVLLLFVAYIMKLDNPIINYQALSLSIKDLILIVGGIFLIWKATVEINAKTEKEGEKKDTKITFNKLLVQVILLDLVFSIDSIITAVGMVNELWIMYTAVIVSLVIMIFAYKPISTFIQEHPSIKILALSFLILIGVTLVGEGLDFKVPKGYIYFSMAFSFIVNLIQIGTNKK
ncbi:MAG: TerC family protein [Chitinophagaceae bacterium]